MKVRYPVLSICILALCLGHHFQARAQNSIITTVAGTDWSFPSGSLAALNAPLGAVEDVALDAAGNVFVADSADSLVLRISVTGTVNVVAGNGIPGFSGDGGPATSASLNYPYGVAVDSAGNLYISDSNNNRIRKVSNGTITTIAGNGKGAFSGDGGPAATASLFDPFGIALDSAGNLYIADAGNGRIRKVSNGTITTIAGNGTTGFSGDGGSAISAQLNVPNGVGVDSTGNVYIADTYNGRIRKVSAGVITTIAGNGTCCFSGDGGPATSAAVSQPHSVALDSAGNFYFDTYNRIRKVSAGTITSVAGNGIAGFSGDGGPATSASLNDPQAVAVDSAGNLYIADAENYRMRKVANGTITTLAGNGNYRFTGDGGPATSASLDSPEGIAVDSAGSLYLADTFNNRIRKVGGGTITTLAGNGNSGFSGDAGPSGGASLSHPMGVALDSSRNLYIADFTNNRVRKVSSGTITTIAGIGAFEFSGDGGQATSASLAQPGGDGRRFKRQRLHSRHLQQPDPEGVEPNDHDVRGQCESGFRGRRGACRQRVAQFAVWGGRGFGRQPLHRRLTKQPGTKGVGRDDHDSRWKREFGILRRWRGSHERVAQLPHRSGCGFGGRHLHRGLFKQPHPQGVERDDHDRSRWGNESRRRRAGDQRAA